jgi:hypothetical protein
MKYSDKHRKEIIEQFGLDSKFLNQIGLSNIGDGGVKTKSTIKLYIPKYQLELFQTLAIYFKLSGISISHWTRNTLEAFAKDLISNDDELFKDAQNVHRELKELSYKQLIEKNGDS